MHAEKIFRRTLDERPALLLQEIGLQPCMNKTTCHAVTCPPHFQMTTASLHSSCEALMRWNGCRVDIQSRKAHTDKFCRLLVSFGHLRRRLAGRDPEVGAAERLHLARLFRSFSNVWQGLRVGKYPVEERSHPCQCRNLQILHK